MKHYILAFLLLFSTVARADADDDAMLKSMAETFFKVGLQETAKKELINYVKTNVSAQAGSRLSTAFVIYSVYQGFQDFQKADTDSQKFYAAANTTAAILASTGVGIIPALVVLGGELASASVAGEYQKEILAIENERLEVIKQLEAIQVPQIEAEYKFYLDMYKAIRFLESSAKDNDATFEANCSNVEKITSPVVLQNCQQSVTLDLFLAEEYVQILDHIANNSNQFITLDAFLNAIHKDRSEFEKNFDANKKILESKRQKYAYLSAAYVKYLTALADYLVKVSPEYTQAKLKTDCIGRLSEKSIQFLRYSIALSTVKYEEDRDYLKKEIIQSTNNFELNDLSFCKQVQGVSSDALFFSTIKTMKSLRLQVGVNS